MSLLRRSKASAAPRKTPKPRGCRVCAGCGEAYPGYYIVARDGAGEDVCYECWTDCVVTSWAGAYLSDRYEYVPKVHRIYFPLPVESRQPDAGAGLRSIGNGIRAQRKPFDLLTEDAAEIGRKELRPFAVIRALAGRTVYVNYRAGKARRRRPTPKPGAS